MMAKNTAPATERSSPFDAWIGRSVLQPLASRLPSSLHPNTLTLLTPILATTSFLCAAAAPSYEGSLPAVWLRLVAGLGMVGSMLTDHLDGLHARNTKQTSKMGELLDHWLDCYHVALAGAGLGLTLHMPAWLVGLSMLSTSAIYNAQLVLFQQTKRFVHPRLGGAMAQSTLGFGYAAFGAVFYFFPPNLAPINAYLPWLWGILIVLQFYEPTFFYRYLGKDIREHFRFLALGSVFCFGAHAGWLRLEVMLILLTLFSLRVSGTYVTRTVVSKSPYAGPEPLLVMGIAGLAIFSTIGNQFKLGQIPMAQAAAGLLIAYLCVTSISELFSAMKIAVSRHRSAAAA